VRCSAKRQSGKTVYCDHRVGVSERAASRLQALKTFPAAAPSSRARSQLQGISGHRLARFAEGQPSSRGSWVSVCESSGPRTSRAARARISQGSASPCGASSRERFSGSSPPAPRRAAGTQARASADTAPIGRLPAKGRPGAANDLNPSAWAGDLDRPPDHRDRRHSTIKTRAGIIEKQEAIPGHREALALESTVVTRRTRRDAVGDGEGEEQSGT